MTACAFLTPTFGPDRERCELLVRSLDRFAPDIKHYLIVDGFEMELFQPLASARTILVRAEDVLGLRQWRVRLRHNFWLNPKTLPMRGWVRQQLLKMAATSKLGPEVLICLDSDVTFVRPFDAGALIEDGRLGLLDVSYQDDMVEAWTKVACSLLGLRFRPELVRGHVGHLITWSRDHMLSLQDRIQKVSGLQWQVAIGRHRTFSEYVLYGLFIRECLGYEQSSHTPSNKALVRQPWEHDLTTLPGLTDFISRPEPDNVAVMVHSKFEIPVARLQPLFDEAWSANRAAEV